jgi:hypothetical protein
MVLLISPVAALFAVGDGGALPLSDLSGMTYGGNPYIASPAPSYTAVLGQTYTYNATCSDPDNGTTTWTLETNASWLSIASGGTGFNTCNLSGMPTNSFTSWVNLTVNDTDSYDFINWTIVVRQQGQWGSVETFSSLPTGTHDPFAANMTGGKLNLIKADLNEESVVLDGTLATFSRANEANQTIATYEPNHVNDGLGWNMSVELYPTREESSFRALLKPVPKLGMIVYLGNDTVNVTAVALYVGDPAQGLERIKVLDATSGLWTDLALDIIPSFPNRHDDSPGSPQLSESIYGEKPDRYIVSFRYANSDASCKVTVIRTGVGMVGSFDAPLPLPMPRDFKMRLVSDDEIPIVPPYGQYGYWMIDNIGMRAVGARYPVQGPVYEYVTKGDPVWISLKDIDGNVISNATVTISGVVATYNNTRQRYEAVLTMPVGWNEPLQCSLTSDGVTLTDRMTVTVMPNLKVEKVSLPLWWNGWAWASVFGRDDSTYATNAVDTYSGYNHPATSYIMSSAGGGLSTDLLATQSEVGIHWPHDYLQWSSRFWDDAVIASQTGHAALENTYTFASRWDDPSYVGVGDMYITIACPGNSGSWEQMYAEYARGTRIMGLTSNYYNGAPGNYSLIGSWYSQSIPPVSTKYNAPISQWYPYTPYDLMDAARGPNTDNNFPSVVWQMTFWMAQNGGVMRVYNHGVISPTAAALLHWIDDPKTNFTYENWKATDGEVASYVYGRWSTDIVYDPSGSNSTLTAYHVSRADPISAGYWRVPVTIAFNATGRRLSDISITEGNKTLLMSDGSLRNLTGKRIMDVGYDIRGDTVYVSYFWNASTNLSFVFADAFPEPNTPPTASFVVDSYYGNITKVFVFDASTSTDAEDSLAALYFRWDWNGDGVWDTDWSSDPIAHHQFASPGNYTVKLQVIDRGGLTGDAQANVEVTDIEIPEMPSVLLAVMSMLAVFSAIAFVSRPRSKKR